MKRAHQARVLRQLSYLLRGRVTLDRALQLATAQSQDLADAAGKIQQGIPLSEALDGSGSPWDRVTLALLRSGEAQGNLPMALETAAKRIENAEAFRRRVRSALAYPGVVLLLASLLIAALLGFVLPRLTSLVQQATDAESLPWLTRVAFQLGGPNGVFLIAGLGALGFLAYRFRRRWQRWLPGVNTLVLAAREQALADGLGPLLRAGVRLTDALETMREVLGDLHDRQALAEAAARVRSGVPLGAALREVGFASPATAEILDAALEGDSLPEALALLAQENASRLEAALGAVLAWLEPVLIVTVGLLVLGVILAVFVPLTTLLESLTG